MIKTFTGYSTDGLDLAVKDAEKDFNAFMKKREDLAIQQITTTSQAFENQSSDRIEYWFTITILTRAI